YEDHVACAGTLVTLGVDPGPLAICRTSSGPLTLSGLKRWVREQKEFIVFDETEEYVEDLSANQRNSLKPDDGVLVCSGFQRSSPSWFTDADDDLNRTYGWSFSDYLRSVIDEVSDGTYWEWEPGEPQVIGQSNGEVVETQFVTGYQL